MRLKIRLVTMCLLIDRSIRLSVAQRALTLREEGLSPIGIFSAAAYWRQRGSWPSQLCNFQWHPERKQLRFQLFAPTPAEPEDVG